MIPQKLKPGDEIRVISPSQSLGLISEQSRNTATERLEEMGLKVSYSKNSEKKDEFDSSSIESRVEDLHEAFSDKNVKGILTSIGGFNVNQILKYLDYDLIKNNPKILCGYSDITALGNAIYKKTGLITYSGPHFSTFGMIKGIDYTVEYFKKCLMEKNPFEIFTSKEWSDDRWYLDQEKREFIKNEGYLLINEGEAEGKIIGGNVCTLNLLLGTEFMPSLKDSILFLEDDEESRSKRHLMEYWHIKAELAFGDREDIINLIENIITYLTEKCSENSQEILKILSVKMCMDGLKTPYSRISYEEAIAYLKKKGVDIEYGKGLGSKEEEILSTLYDGPFWVVGIPRCIEPFPYCIDQRDNRVTMVADLIASNGYGELLGVAEKISDFDMLSERMQEKGKLQDPRYEWVREVHQMGCVPHIAFGMGVERLIRWFLNISHVRDAIPFPRIFRRQIYP